MESNDNASSCPRENQVPRRKALGWLVALINVGVVAAVTGPVARFVAWPMFRKKEPGKWVPVMADADLPQGATRSVTFTVDVRDGYMESARKYSAFVTRGANGVVAFDPTCPHLGCHVEFKERKQRYVCPCHGGAFAADGSRISGPPPTGLTKIATRVQDGQIWLYKA